MRLCKRRLLLAVPLVFLIILVILLSLVPKPTRIGKHFQNNFPSNERQEKVVEAFLHAWTNYKTYAWGHDHLKPISKTFEDGFHLGLTIIDSLDTMYIMGLNTGKK